MEDDFYDFSEDDSEELEVKPGASYITYHCQRADIMYYVKHQNQNIFFGHVYEETANGILPIAVQWDATGKVDESLYDEGYSLTNFWKEPKRYIRYLYIYDEFGLILTKVSDKPLPHKMFQYERVLLASKKVILKGL